MRASLTEFVLRTCLAFGTSCALAAESPPAVINAFVEQHCVQCHDATETAGGLNLHSLEWSLVTDEDRER
jgi:hypothetical protein